MQTTRFIQLRVTQARLQFQQTAALLLQNRIQSQIHTLFIFVSRTTPELIFQQAQVQAQIRVQA